MKQFLRIIHKHKKASVFGLFFLIVFVGMSVTSAIHVAQERAQASAKTEAAQTNTQSADTDTAYEEVTLSDTQKSLIEKYDADTKKVIDSLKAHEWSADRSLLKFSDTSYSETLKGVTKTHSYAISRVETQVKKDSTVYTIIFETDTGSHIVSFIDGSGINKDGKNVVESTLRSSSMFLNSDTDYRRVPSKKDIELKGLNKEFTALVGNDTKNLTKELTQYCVLNYPSVTTATWDKVAYIDFDKSIASFTFMLNTEPETQLLVHYHMDSNTYDFGE